MRATEIKRFEAHARRAVMRPLKKGGGENNPVMFGYDTEYTDEKLLSFSLSFRDPSNDELISRMFMVMQPTMKSAVLWDAIKKLRREFNLPKKSTYYLVAHFSQADISRIEDFDHVHLAENMHTKLMEVSNTYIGSVRPTTKTTIKFLDLFTFFKTSLARIGDIMGVEKLDVDQFYKEHMDVFLKEKPELYEAYANRDAEITYLAFEELRKTSDPFEVTPIRYPTAPALSLAIFRKKFMSRASCRYNEIDKGIFYADNWRIRIQSLRSYWGGHNESFYYGRLTGGTYKQYDVKSLYPHAAMLQPLPDCNTDWKFINKLTTKKDILDMEGFVTVQFRFPDGIMYPSLPVATKDCLAFPLRGVSSCTIAELRVAELQGCDWTVLQGYGFTPTYDEVNHDLVAFFKHFNAEKDATDKKADPFKYAFVKLCMNSLIGKFVQRKTSTDIVTVAKRYGVAISELHGIIDPRLDELKEDFTDTHLGSGFSPEWAALILGQARAIMAEINHYNKPYMCVTDSLLIDHDLVRCGAIERLESVGSSLELEKTCTSAYLMRLRTYWLIDDYIAQLFDPELDRLAELGGLDRINPVVKKAVHGLGISPRDTNFDRCVLDYFYNDVPLPESIDRKRLARFKESWRRGVRWNEEIHTVSHPTYLPDKKRVLVALEGWTTPLVVADSD